MAQRAFRALNRRGFRTILGLARSAQILARDRELCLVTPEHGGGWRLRSRDAELFAPGPNMRPISRARARVPDLFCRTYTPGSGDIVLEVGAGVGRDAFVFSELVGPTGSVHCIEAHPGTFALLERTRDANELENVRCYLLAASAHDGAVTIDTQVDPRLYYRNKLVSDGEGVIVPAVTLASFMAEQGIECVHLLAMNIEGAEVAALRGMAGVADRVGNVVIACHDFLADETGDERMRTKAEVCELLRGYGFAVNERRDGGPAWRSDYVYGSRS